MRMIFLFIDGFGIGSADAEKNPVFAARTPGFDYIRANGLFLEADASLGVPGLPQSATGQATIFTGINAPQLIGRHLNAQPTARLREIIAEDNLFIKLKRLGLRVTFANAYRTEYLERMNDPSDKRYKPSVTSVMTMSSGEPFRLAEEYRAGKAIFHDLTGQIAIENGFETDPITPDQAAGRLYGISREYDLTMFEHFLTDIIGHRMDMQQAVAEIELLDTFLGGLLKRLDPEEDILFITSDHGNIEDVSVKTHTFNKVPIIIYGRLPGKMRPDITDLTGITPAVVEIFRQGISSNKAFTHADSPLQI